MGCSFDGLSLLVHACIAPAVGVLPTEYSCIRIDRRAIAIENVAGIKALTYS